MVYVNKARARHAAQISEIVHGVADETHGATNKSTGDGFLVVWRIRDLDYAGRIADLSARPASAPRDASLRSLFAFAKILAGLHVSPVLAEYRTHPGPRVGNCGEVWLGLRPVKPTFWGFAR